MRCIRTFLIVLFLTFSRLPAGAEEDEFQTICKNPQQYCLQRCSETRNMNRSNWNSTNTQYFFRVAYNIQTGYFTVEDIPNGIQLRATNPYTGFSAIVSAECDLWGSGYDSPQTPKTQAPQSLACPQCSGACPSCQTKCLEQLDVPFDVIIENKQQKITFKEYCEKVYGSKFTSNESSVASSSCTSSDIQTAINEAREYIARMHQKIQKEVGKYGWIVNLLPDSGFKRSLLGLASDMSTTLNQIEGQLGSYVNEGSAKIPQLYQQLVPIARELVNAYDSIGETTLSQLLSPDDFSRVQKAVNVMRAIVNGGCG